MSTEIEPHQKAYYEVASDIRALHDEIRAFADKIEELEGDIVILITVARIYIRSFLESLGETDITESRVQQELDEACEAIHDAFRNVECQP